MIIKTFVEGPIDANNYLVIDEKSKDAVLIDCSSTRNEFINEIKDLGVNLKYILLTHGHFDHILGVDGFKGIFNVDVYMSEKDIPQVEMATQMMQMFTGLPVPEIKGINKYLNDGDEFFIGETKIKAIATAGHTEGGMCYLIEDKLFSGDTLFQLSVGRTDFPGGDYNQIVNSVRNILFNLPEDTEVYPGHGDKTNIGYEKKYNKI